jgi:nitrogen-specific signal transduction histidine kinase/ActR/RegA family two-component response regulator
MKSELDHALKRIRGLEQELQELRSKLLESRQLEEQLIQAQKMESLANLAAGIAHDFNNILQSILGYTQLALISEKETDRETFRHIEKIVAKGRELTEQFLTFGRKRLPSFSSLDLNQKVRDVMNLLRRTIPKMIDIELDLSDDLKEIHADPSQIEQILMNLGINAKDAMPQGGRLLFRTRNVRIAEDHPLHARGRGEREYALLSVEDTGCGIAPEDMKRIYEPFFTTKAKGQGTGLGLAMVYAIIKNHGGFIECSSIVDRGTAFSLFFPAAKSMRRTLGQPVQQTTGSEDWRMGTETLLLVEDDTDILNPLKEILGRCGYRVITAENGERAVEVYSTGGVDLVILDVSMPGMGGLRCLQEILKIDREAKVIISTGLAPSHPASRSLESAAKVYLSKPYRINELLKAIRVSLDRAVSPGPGQETCPCALPAPWGTGIRTAGISSSLPHWREDLRFRPGTGLRRCRSGMPVRST